MFADLINLLNCLRKKILNSFYWFMILKIKLISNIFYFLVAGDIQIRSCTPKKVCCADLNLLCLKFISSFL